MNAQFSTGVELCQNHDSGKGFFVNNSVFQLGIIEPMGPEGHMFIILDDLSSHLIAGSIGINVKWFIVIRICQEAISCHKCFDVFKGKVNFGCPAKVFLPGLAGERYKNMCMLRQSALLVVDNTKKTVHW